MVLKIIANVLLNLGVFTLGLSVYWSFKSDHPGLALAAIFSLALLIFLKIRLMKSVKEMTKNKK